ncbi:hypothetical protein K435DRAFT_963675 [Dendrothele bispora CBS 962.96]|uniref:Uncharacterized protein n=1 Tax=Dendrothele bispora (strain CBS 962.96) TaxID=1314807 RepID=A0A4S8MET6_DENBC|nr:hypothetical protein K435DRAFT_963675 [Dendrothele bispora CBS 962.96]
MFKATFGFVSFTLLAVRAGVAAPSSVVSQLSNRVCPAPYPSSTPYPPYPSSSYPSSSYPSSSYPSSSYPVSSYPSSTAYGYSSRSLVPRQSGGNASLSFTGADWIWRDEFDSSGRAPVGVRGFRKVFNPPEGKIPSTLEIASAVDDIATLFVNGEEIGTNYHWPTANAYCVPLYPGSNVIAFNATNLDLVGPLNHAALLVTAVVTYTDGTTSRIVSDLSWRVSASLPSGWEQPGFDDSSWEAVISEGTYPTQDPDNYGTVSIAGVNPLSYAQAHWIWTSENPKTLGTRALRRTLDLPPGNTNASGQVLIVADDEYSLYVNGHFVGTGMAFPTVQRFNISNIQGPRVVVAVYAVNTNPTQAGVLAAMQITSFDPYGCVANCTSETSILTDVFWKVSTNVTSGFEQPNFDDSTWSPITQDGTGTSRSPTAPGNGISPSGTPLPGAPAGN